VDKPYYSRYSQTGVDAQDIPVGGRDETVSGRTKGWKQIVFTPGTAPQVPELNEMQEILLDAIKDIGDFVLRDGQTRGLQLRLDLSSNPKLAHIEWQDPAVPGQVYVNGLFHTVPQTTLTLQGTGRETIVVRVTPDTVTEVEDPVLYNIVVGDDTAGGPGAYRRTFLVTCAVKTDANAADLADALDLYELSDGQLRISSNDVLNEVDRNLVLYTADLAGDCITGNGMTVRVEDANANQLRVVVDRGTAYVNGRRVGYKTSTPLLITKAKFDTETVTGELLHSVAAADGTMVATITPVELPVKQVDTFNLLVAIQRAGDFHQYPFTQNPLDPTEIFIEKSFPFGPLFKVVAVYDDVTNAALDFTPTTQGFRFTSGLPSHHIRAVWIFNATLSGTTDYTVASDKLSLQLTGDYPDALNNGTAMDTGVDRAQYVYPGIASTELAANTVPNTATKGTNNTHTTIAAIGSTLVTSGTYTLTVAAGTTSGYKFTYGTGTPVDNVAWVNGATVNVTDSAGGTLTLTLGSSAPSTPQSDTVTVTVGTTVVTLDKNDGLVVGMTLALQAGALPDVSDETRTIAEVMTLNRVRIDHPLAAAYTSGDVVYTDRGFVGVPLSNDYFPITLAYRWLLDRVDLVYIDEDNQIVVQSGQSNKPAYAPTVPRGVLPIANLVIPANSDASSVRVDEYPVRALTQQETRQLKIAIDQINYNAAIQDLKLASYNKSTAAGLALRGLLTDALVNSDTLDINSAPTAWSNVQIDPDKGVLSPTLTMETLSLAVDTTQTTCFVGSKAAVLGHSLVGSTQIVNVRATHGPDNTPDLEVPRGTSNAARPTVAVVTGDYTGAPQGASAFNFLNTQSRSVETVPTALEGGFWRTRKQQPPWLAARQLYLPAMTLTMEGRNLPNGIYTVTVDGQPVLDGLGAAVTITVTSGTFTNAAVPLVAGTATGDSTRTISLINASNQIVASTVYGATPAATATLPIAHDALAANRFVQVAQTFSYTRDVFIRGLNLFFGRVGGGWVEVQIRNTLNNGEPGDEILARKRLLVGSTTFSTVAETRIEFNDVVFCPANTAFAVVIEAADENWGIKKAVVGHADQNNTLMVSAPITGAIYSSTDGGGWVIQTQNCLTFQLLECLFSASDNQLVFQPVSAAVLPGLDLIIARAQQLVPRGAALAWSYKMDGNATATALPVDADGTLDPQALPHRVTSLVLQATLRGTTAVSAAVATTNAKLLAFEPAALAVYPTRLATNVPQYNQARVTLDLSILSGITAVTAKLSMVDDPLGLCSTTLSGVPVTGDQLTLVLDGISRTYTYTGGTGTLADFATRALAYFTAQFSQYTLAVKISGSNRILTAYRNNRSAFVTGDASVTAVPAGGSTLAAAALSFNYVTMTQQAGSTPVDDTYVTLAFTATGLSPAAVGGSYLFRVKLDVRTDTPQFYTQLRNISAVVSN
jgi:hypothetical protein